MDRASATRPTRRRRPHPRVDTGSKDKTPEIAARFADEVLTFPWCDDFSAARNFALSHIHTDWVYGWYDADETISPESGRELREAIRDPNARGLTLRRIHVNSDEPHWDLNMAWRHHPAGDGGEYCT